MASLFADFSFVAGRGAPRQAPHFFLPRQDKVSIGKAIRRQGRCAVPCAARIGRVGRKLGFLSNMRPPVPPAAALLSPVTTALETELLLLGCAITNSRDSQHLNSPSRSGVCTCSSTSEAKRDTTQCTCKVGANERAHGSCTRSHPQPTAISAGSCAAARSLARLFLGGLSLGNTKESASAAGSRPGLQ